MHDLAAVKTFFRTKKCAAHTFCFSSRMRDGSARVGRWKAPYREQNLDHPSASAGLGSLTAWFP